MLVVLSRLVKAWACRVLPHRLSVVVEEAGRSVVVEKRGVAHVNLWIVASECSRQLGKRLVRDVAAQGSAADDLAQDAAVVRAHVDAT